MLFVKIVVVNQLELVLLVVRHNVKIMNLKMKGNFLLLVMNLINFSPSCKSALIS